MTSLKCINRDRCSFYICNNNVATMVTALVALATAVATSIAATAVADTAIEEVYDLPEVY